MPGTYSQLLLHIVYLTKGRTPWIGTDVAERLHPYLGGIVRAERGVLYDTLTSPNPRRPQPTIPHLSKGTKRPCCQSKLLTINNL